MRGLVAMVLLSAVLFGCGSAASVSSPESVIEAVLAAAREADYNEAVRYFEDGPEQLERAPQYVRDFIERISDKGNAVGFVVKDRLERGDTLLLQITTYSDPEQKQPLQMSIWHFSKAGKRWIITRVE